METLSLFRFGTALGLTWGGLLLLIAVLSRVTGLGIEFIHITGSIFRGYGPGPLGGIIGGVWGCCVGFVLGVSMAWIYNRLSLQESGE
ncbi:MAG: hypothetical protein E2P03_06430 [Acidobacteria bacterium]|nr:MAG: hypothetical protein E2P03_06430 [Acidobacteriota bacterium]